MRVKRLDIFGFKSFATKTSVHFEPGVTAIVGPNGSGKSNIVDSVRWVMGEHNPRDVRAPRLEDIIFNGTDSKAPLSMAEVTLLIENDRGLLPIAFSEVSLTRRVYRSGESECFINQSPCRLKDIQELLMGTGLGGGAYAIIAQGHIDQILSSKPEERRAPFEEASGVAKFLAKKHETMRRLDEVEEHLVRIADITSEVKRQLNALERQAAKARQYKTQWEQLKSAEVRLAADELREGLQVSLTVGQEVETLQAKRRALDEQRQQAMASLETRNAQIASIHGRLQELRAQVVECASRIQQHTEQRALKARWIDELTTQRQRLERETIQLEERATQLVQQLDRIRGDHEALEQQYAQLKRDHTQTQDALLAVEAEESQIARSLEQAKAGVFEAAAAASQRRNEMNALALRLQGLDAQLARSRSQRQSVEQRLQGFAQRTEQAQQERDTLAEQERGCREQFDAARQFLSQAQAERDELTGRLRQAREQLVQEQAKVAMLEEVARRDEGVPEAVKALLATPPEGTIGLLADLIDVDAGFEQAVESVLGELALSVVVRDRPALQRCHTLLAGQSLQWARFIVLADCPSTQGPSVAPSGEGVLGGLRQFVHCEAGCEPLADWLLGSWVVTDTIERVWERPQGCWVTRSGDRRDAHSWRFVGSTKPFARVGLLRRLEQSRRELETQQRAVDGLQAAWQYAEGRCQALSGQESAARQQLDGLVPKRANIDAVIGQLAHDTRRLEEESKALEMDAEQAASQQRELVDSQSAVASAVAEAEAGQRNVEAGLKQLQLQLEEAHQRRQKALIASAQLETAVLSCEGQLSRLQTRVDEIRQEREAMTKQLEDKRADVESVDGRKMELAAQLEEHASVVAALATEQGELQAGLTRVTDELRVEERARDQVLPGLLTVEQELAAVAKRIEEQERHIADRTYRRSRILERLHEVYRIDEATLSAEQQSLSPLPPEERQALGEQIERLKHKLEAAGPVSMGSVEEYDELAKRLEFLKAQQEDLVKARDDLRNSIQQINRQARQQFRETFVIIRQEFQGYFQKLFGGGQADLILLDEEDVLESGIEIVARPPGKRLQSISLLSGGERAMTAVALLFAFFKVRPSPFCILDEIDAPLDEANVDRFARVLEEFLTLSQFILITHNKKTISKADCLYGVTMEQPGMSKVVSVKLRQKRTDPTAAADIAPQETVSESPSASSEAPAEEPVAAAVSPADDSPAGP